MANLEPRALSPASTSIRHLSATLDPVSLGARALMLAVAEARGLVVGSRTWSTGIGELALPMVRASTSDLNKAGREMSHRESPKQLSRHGMACLPLFAFLSHILSSKPPLTRRPCFLFKFLWHLASIFLFFPSLLWANIRSLVLPFVSVYPSSILCQPPWASHKFSFVLLSFWATCHRRDD